MAQPLHKVGELFASLGVAILAVTVLVMLAMLGWRGGFGGFLFRAINICLNAFSYYMLGYTLNRITLLLWFCSGDCSGR